MYLLLFAIFLDNNHPLSGIVEDKDSLSLFFLNGFDNVSAKIGVDLGERMFWRDHKRDRSAIIGIP